MELVTSSPSLLIQFMSLNCHTSNPDDFDEESEDELNDGFASDSSLSSSSSVDEEYASASSKPVVDDKTGFVLFRCSDSNCAKWYRSFNRCEDHIVSGKHVYPSTKVTLIDAAIETYKSYSDKIIRNNKINVSTINSTTESFNSSSTIAEGWALPQPRSNRRFTKEQIAFLVEKYDEGERTGHKWNPSTVAAVSLSYLID